MIQHVRLEYKQIESRKHEHNCKTKYRLNKVDFKKNKYNNQQKELEFGCMVVFKEKNVVILTQNQKLKKLKIRKICSNTYLNGSFSLIFKIYDLIHTQEKGVKILQQTSCSNI